MLTLDVCRLGAEDLLSAPEPEVEETLHRGLGGVALPGAHVQVVVLVGVARGEVLPEGVEDLRKKNRDL